MYARLNSQLDRYQEVVEPLRRLAMWGIPIFFGFFAGFAASAQWETTWLWVNGVATSVTDPQFGLDTGFYLFAMPSTPPPSGSPSAVVLVCPAADGRRVVPLRFRACRPARVAHLQAARIQLAILAGLYLLLQVRACGSTASARSSSRRSASQAPATWRRTPSSPARRSSRSPQ